MEISAINDPAALNGIADMNRKASNVAAQQQPQPEKTATEQPSTEAISYSQSGITVDISEQGMEASKRNAASAPVNNNPETTDYNKVYLEARTLLDENLPDMQIRERTQISETELDRIRKETATQVLS